MEKMDFMEMVEAYQRERNFKCSRVEAMQAVMKRDPEAHRRYIEKANEPRREGRLV